MSLEEQIASLLEIHAAFKNTKIDVEKAVKRLWRTVQWVLGIGITLMVLLLGGFGELRVRQSNTEQKVQTINQNYTPFELILSLEESNKKVQEALIASKNGKDIEELLKAYKDFTDEALRRIQTQINTTRGGYGYDAKKLQK